MSTSVRLNEPSGRTPVAHTGCGEPRTPEQASSPLGEETRGALYSGHELLSLLVERRPLLHRGEALDLQERTRLVDGHDPRVHLPQGAPLLAHDPARLVLHQVRLLQPRRGLPDLPPC